jgi:hypothetical protein
VKHHHLRHRAGAHAATHGTALGSLRRSDTISERRSLILIGERRAAER